jgi:hypothetical protein
MAAFDETAIDLGRGAAAECGICLAASAPAVGRRQQRVTAQCESACASGGTRRMADVSCRPGRHGQDIVAAEKATVAGVSGFQAAGLAPWPPRARCRLNEKTAPSNSERGQRVSITDRARRNREYVRRLLAENSPEFAAVLERVVRELAHESDARARYPAPRPTHQPDEPAA